LPQVLGKLPRVSAGARLRAVAQRFGNSRRCQGFGSDACFDCACTATCRRQRYSPCWQHGSCWSRHADDLSQIAAEELDIAVEHVTMHGTNTNTSPFDRSTAASRSTGVMGNAIRSAAGELRQQIIDAAAEVLHAEQKNINLKTGEVICGDKRVSTARFEYVFRDARGGCGSYSVVDRSIWHS
jgi:hypothetical protein